MSRKAYMEGKITHQDHYMAVAKAIGIPALRRLVESISDRNRIAECLKTDEHLNNIPLHLWDMADGPVQHLIAKSGNIAGVMAESWDHPKDVPVGRFYWSLGETVCVLKAIARDMARDICTNCGQWRNDGRCLNDCQQKGLDMVHG